MIRKYGIKPGHFPLNGLVPKFVEPFPKIYGYFESQFSPFFFKINMAYSPQLGPCLAAAEGMSPPIEKMDSSLNQLVNVRPSAGGALQELNGSLRENLQ